MWKDNEKNMHDSLEKGYVKNGFLKDSGFGIDSKGRIEVAELIKMKGIKNILDIPCGNSVMYEVLKAQIPDIEYHGCDLTDQMIEVSMELYPELSGKFKKAYIQDTGYEDKQFSIVIARHIFEHIPDWKESITECIRIAKDYVYFVFYKAPGNEENIKFVSTISGDYYLNTYKESDVIALFRSRTYRKYTVVSDKNNAAKTTDTIYEVRI